MADKGTGKAPYWQGFHIILLKGLFMGIADIIPGVSGGTIALITGIYERLVHSLSSVNFGIEAVFRERSFNRLMSELRGVDFPLFLPLVLGIGTAILLMSNLITYLIQKQTGITFGFFFGLILGSAFILYQRIHPWNVRTFLFSILGAGVSFLLVNSAAISLGHSLPIVFASGVLAIIAMILPGISGSFILLLIGQYSFMLRAVKSLNLVVMLTFSTGAILGLLGFSRVLDFILSRWENLTLCFLVGLMLGALYLPYKNICLSISIMWQVLVAGFIGFAAVLLLHWKAKA